MLALAEKHAERTLESLEIASDPLGLKILIHPTPRTGLEAKFSLPYCAAVAWLDGWPGLAAFSDERAARADVQHLLRRVVVREARGADEEVEAAFADGTRERLTARHARGSPDLPLGDYERLEKVHACIFPELGVGAPERLIAAVGELESHSDVRELARCLA